MPFVRARKHAPPTLVGRWLLDLPVHGAVAAVEAEALVTKFNTVHILVSRCEAPGGWTDPAMARALSFVISGIMIIGRADYVMVVPLSPDCEKELAALGWGAPRPVWTPLQLPEGGGMRLTTMALDPHDWWLTPGGESDRRTLSYLDKRVRFEDEKQKPPTRRRQGFLDRLSRMIRWS